MSEAKPSPTTKYLLFLIIGIFLMVIALAFHFVPSQMKMFPKENLTLSKTILSQDDIEKAIERYNNSMDIFGQRPEVEERFVLTLLEYGIVDSSEIYFISFDDDPDVGRIDGTVIGGSEFEDKVDEILEKYERDKLNNE
jgi:hypothetical protein